MKKYIVIVMSLLLPLCVVAQDAMRLSEREVVGTARYVGMAGAMTAVGGDPSAAMDNPAGLGLYRRWEMSATLDVVADQTYHVVNPLVAKKNNCMLKNVAVVFSFVNPYNVSGFIGHNFMIGYRRLRSFDRNLNIVCNTNDYSIAHYAAAKTDGLQPIDVQRDGRWDDSDVGWISLLAYDNYVIHPDGVPGDYTGKWHAALSDGVNVRNELKIEEWGNVSEFNLSWAMNMSHKWYVGLGLNLRTLSYSKQATYLEKPESGGYIRNYSAVSMSGIGFNANVGLIYRPIRAFRMGLSLQTPSITQLTTSNYGKMSSDLGPEPTSINTPDGRITNTLHMPLNMSVGMATQIQQYGLISVQYDLAAMRGYVPVHTIRLGVEAVIKRSFFLEAGYALESSFVAAKQLLDSYRISYNSIRTDTDLRKNMTAHTIGAGFGFKGSLFTGHVAYQYRLQNFEQFAYESLFPFDMRGDSHRVVLTLNWHTRAYR